jgi:MFS family permease
MTAMTGFGIFVPIFPFLGLAFGASPMTIIYAMGAYSLGQMIAAPAWGRLSDRFGRKPVLVVGLLGASLSYIAVAFSTSIAEMGAARFVGGLMAGNIGAAFAAAADLSDERTRARNMGLIGAAFGFGFIIGPALGGFTIGADPTLADFRRVCFYAAGFSTLAAIAAYFVLAETRVRAPSPPPRARLRTLIARPVLAQLAIVMTLLIAAQAVVETTFGLWAQGVIGWTPQEVGYLFAVFGLAAALLQGGAAGALARRFGERNVLAGGLCLFLAGFAVLATAADTQSALVGMGLLAVSSGVTGPALQSLFAIAAAAEERGAVMGLSQSASAFGRVLGPLAAGPLFERGGGSLTFLASLAVLAAALVLVLRLKPRG